MRVLSETWHGVAHGVEWNKERDQLRPSFPAPTMAPSLHSLCRPCERESWPLSQGCAVSSPVFLAAIGYSFLFLFPLWNDTVITGPARHQQFKKIEFKDPKKLSVVSWLYQGPTCVQHSRPAGLCVSDTFPWPKVNRRIEAARLICITIVNNGCDWVCRWTLGLRTTWLTTRLMTASCANDRSSHQL